LFDLPARRFYVFGLVLWPHDLVYLAGLLILAALALFFFTTVAGRLWCGYACPQTVYTQLFLWVEQRIEGPRKARIKLDAAPWSRRKVRIKATKHALWLVMATLTGLTFVGYFIPIRTLITQIFEGQLGPWPLFWIVFYSVATWGNAGFMREQVCRYMCPYARFQGAMFDADTLIITYDRQRGEPRGTRPRQTAPGARGLGSCIDCSLCVQVCPTGIDIRQGLQYECIGCAACIDACDRVMDRMGEARGLIRYTSERALNAPLAPAAHVRHIMRPRVLIYGTLLLALTLTLVVALATRSPLRVDVLPDRHAQGLNAAGTHIANSYRVHIMNASEKPQQVRIQASGLAGLALQGRTLLDIPPASHRTVPITLLAEAEAWPPGAHRIEWQVTAADTPTLSQREISTFIVP